MDDFISIMTLIFFFVLSCIIIDALYTCYKYEELTNKFWYRCMYATIFNCFLAIITAICVLVFW